MSKESTKIVEKEVIHAAPILEAKQTIDKNTQDAINEAVQNAVKLVIEQLKISPSTTQPVISKPVPQVNLGHSSDNYKKRLQGIPVQPGEDLRHVAREVVNNWFLAIEARWKDSYNKRKLDGQPASMSWTRGNE